MVLDCAMQDLVRNLAMSQLQHAAAMQQQMTLAALAQQFAVTRAHAGAVTGFFGLLDALNPNPKRVVCCCCEPEIALSRVGASLDHRPASLHS